MLFSHSTNNFPCDIIFDNSPLLRIDCVKFLGIYVDDKFSISITYANWFPET